MTALFYDQKAPRPAAQSIRDRDGECSDARKRALIRHRAADYCADAARLGRPHLRSSRSPRGRPFGLFWGRTSP